MKPNFHPAAPKRLKRLWKDYPAYNRIAKYLNVNPAYVWRAIAKGIEPINKEVRVKFGLPSKPRNKLRKAKVSLFLPDHLRWWKRLDKSTRDVYIKEIYDIWSQNGR